MVLLKSILLILCLITDGFVAGSLRAAAPESGCAHLPLLADLHLPSAHIGSQQRVIQTINSWTDVAMVISLGDLCNDRGTDEEYASVREFFGQLQKPHLAVAGNHDYIYATSPGPTGRRVRAAPAEREAKLNKFKEVFGLSRVFDSREVGPYRLVFLSTDHLAGGLTELSAGQLDWLRAELKEKNAKPTIVFFHAPLEGTLRNYNRTVNTPSFIAQPSGTIGEILAAHPQLFLWVSGHTHTPPHEESFASGINLWMNRVMNIHNTNMNRETIWTNSLFLCPGKVIVRTYDHGRGAWLPAFDRTILPPPL